MACTKAEHSWRLYQLLLFCVEQHLQPISCRPAVVADGTSHAQCPGEASSFGNKHIRKCFAACPNACPGVVKSTLLRPPFFAGLFILGKQPNSSFWPQRALCWTIPEHRHSRYSQAAPPGKPSHCSPSAHPPTRTAGGYVLGTRGTSAPHCHFLMATQDLSMSFWSSAVGNPVQKYLQKAVRESSNLTDLVLRVARKPHSTRGASRWRVCSLPSVKWGLEPPP